MTDEPLIAPTKLAPWQRRLADRPNASFSNDGLFGQPGVPTGNSPSGPQGVLNNPFRFRKGYQPPEAGEARWPIFREEEKGG